MIVFRKKENCFNFSGLSDNDILELAKHFKHPVETCENNLFGVYLEYNIAKRYITKQTSEILYYVHPGDEIIVGASLLKLGLGHGPYYRCATINNFPAYETDEFIGGKSHEIIIVRENDIVRLCVTIGGSHDLVSSAIQKKYNKIGCI